MVSSNSVWNTLDSISFYFTFPYCISSLLCSVVLQKKEKKRRRKACQRFIAVSIKYILTREAIEPVMENRHITFEKNKYVSKITVTLAFHNLLETPEWEIARNICKHKSWNECMCEVWCIPISPRYLFINVNMYIWVTVGIQYYHVIFRCRHSTR